MANPNWKKGTSGNPHGRPARPEIEALRKAIEIVEKKKNTTFLEHFVGLAWKDKNVAIALAKKIVPDLSSIDSTVDNPQLNEEVSKLRQSLKQMIDSVQKSHK